MPCRESSSYLRDRRFRQGYAVGAAVSELTRRGVPYRKLTFPGIERNPRR